METDERIARERSLDMLAGRDGIIVGAAMDHRDALRTTLATRGLALDDAAIGALKARIASALAPHATALLIDTELGLGPAVTSGALAGGVGVVLPLEAAGYGDVAKVVRTDLLAGFSPARARYFGAAAVKLLLPFRVDVAEQAATQEDVVRSVVADCKAHGLALVLEPIVYRRDGEATAGGERFGELVVEGARRLTTLDPGVLKVQHPGSFALCEALDDACGATPWVLLGGGAAPEVVSVQVGEACRAGASGFIVGRSLWEGAISSDPTAAQAALEAEAIPLLQRLAATARASGQPWRARRA